MTAGRNVRMFMLAALCTLMPNDAQFQLCRAATPGLVWLGLSAVRQWVMELP